MPVMYIDGHRVGSAARVCCARIGASSAVLDTEQRSVNPETVAQKKKHCIKELDCAMTTDYIILEQSEKRYRN